MAEQTYREIQLTKKELVFLFMSAVVVLAVVFLLGISVGRTVGAPEGLMADAGPSMASDTLVTTQPPTEADPGELTYHDDLQGGATATPGSNPAGDPPVDPPVDPPADPAADPNTAAVRTDPLPTAPPPQDPDPVTPPATPPATPPTTPPASQARSGGSGQPGSTSSRQGAGATGDWALQFGAFASRDNANRLVAELKQKGYAAYIADTDGLAAVRVGPFQTRAEADSMRQRLAAEPQRYTPLIISR